MIPADLAARLRPVTQDQQPGPVSPTAPLAKLADVLADLVPGQRIMAEIQALLPNGAYRAIIGQREVVLALPFTAKEGDSLELEVKESEGKVSLAFIANRTANANAEPEPVRLSSDTRLSRTGQLIGDILSGLGDSPGKKAQPAPLNGSQPLIETFPADSAELIPVLKKALTESGMFYEAHQAKWVEGRATTDSLLKEPQGRLSSAQSGGTDPGTHAQSSGQAQLATPSSGTHAGVPHTEAGLSDAGKTTAPLPVQESPIRVGNETGLPAPIPQELLPLVQQQLDALSTQNYAWQGQIWPGQTMQWEIQEDPERKRALGQSSDREWQTRLQLALPVLGGIEATLRLRGGKEIEISLDANSGQSVDVLRSGLLRLRDQLSDAGLNPRQLAVNHAATES